MNLYSAGVLPYCKCPDGTIYFLLGKEYDNKWSDFGGKCELQDNGEIGISQSVKRYKASIVLSGEIPAGIVIAISTCSAVLSWLGGVYTRITSISSPSGNSRELHRASSKIYIRKSLQIG